MEEIKAGDKVRARNDLPLKNIKKGDTFTVHSVSQKIWIRLSEDQTNIGDGIHFAMFEKIKE